MCTADTGYLICVHQRLLGHVWEVRAASQTLEEAFNRHTPTPDLNGIEVPSFPLFPSFSLHLFSSLPSSLPPFPILSSFLPPSFIFLSFLPPVPFSEMTEVRLQTVSLYTRLELLVEAAKTMQEQCRVLEGMQRATGGGGSRDTLEPCCVQLLSTVCHQTALYCSRLLQVGGQSDTQTAFLSLGMRLDN